MADLTLPKINTEDPGAHELASSESDHFSDAQEGQPSRPASSASHSPVPVTRVERVDNKPSHGEVPGTPAYQLRTQDAVPDEVEIVPEGQRSRSTSRARLEDDRPGSTGGSPVPKMVVEKVDDKPAYGEVPGTEAYEKRKADAVPDEIIKSPSDSTTNPWNSDEPTVEPRSPSQLDHPMSTPSDEPTEPSQDDQKEDTGGGDNEDFGDDFDDFAEGEEGAEEDFGDFDDDFQKAEAQDTGAFEEYTVDDAPEPPPAPALPTPNFESLCTPDVISETSTPYITELFPSFSSLPDPLPSLPTDLSVFLTDRSHSLYSQLVAPPPLAPPDWIRSRIRRMFLVSLGVPVDLDEILPASKQKRLVLPSVNLGRRSFDDRGSGSPSPLNRLRDADAAAKNASSTSVNSSISSPRKVRRTATNVIPPEPVFDAPAARMLTSTTAEKMVQFSDEELRQHRLEVERLIESAEEVLTYWEKRTEEVKREKEAFEGVISNLVRHARKVRA
ncbi:hypothetical protein K402DRAFT_379019 [Aulographum hederae CBS 113979]|uniref:Uncharacterized protein n=1 Tax=Aulographum hederae CBS 113979 TaxID=1176131 RepID=A0A6G1GXL7_9PEZI|nr:hypothetical protein K402DRAFT_379019 [Aulographum hederae CBS 113979]